MEHSRKVDPESGDILFRAVQAVSAIAGGSDPYLAGHATRVAEYADQLADDLGLAEPDRLLLWVAAVFHDIGMLATPPYILRKPTTLAESEMEEVRVHPLKGAELFEGDPRLAPVAEAIRHHHERFDGSGYPTGLAGEAIPLSSRIILVAETYEAMTHDRAYRRAGSHAEAVRELRESAGTQLDPMLVERFLALIDPPAD